MGSRPFNEGIGDRGNGEGADAGEVACFDEALAHRCRAEHGQKGSKEKAGKKREAGTILSRDIRAVLEEPEKREGERDAIGLSGGCEAGAARREEDCRKPDAERFESEDDKMPAVFHVEGTRHGGCCLPDEGGNQYQMKAGCPGETKREKGGDRPDDPEAPVWCALIHLQ